MINVSKALLESVGKNYNIHITQAIPLNETVQIKTSDNKNYILKRVKNREVIDIYYFLLAQKFTYFIMPELTIYKQLFMIYNQQYYYLIKYYDDIDYPIEKKLIDYIDLLHKLHKSSIIRKNFNKSQFNRLYRRKLRRIDSHFHLLDLFMIECENKKYKSIFDWTYMVKYNEIMYIKNLLVKIDSQIENLLEKLDLYDYCIIHNNPSIDHFIVTNEKNYLISFDHSTIGFKVHDYIKLFIDYSDIDVDWMTLIVNDEITKFEFYYFIFNVLYFIILNIDITFLKKNQNYESINTLIHSLDVGTKAIDLYQKYESIYSSTEEEK